MEEDYSHTMVKQLLCVSQDETSHIVVLSNHRSFIFAKNFKQKIDAAVE